VLLVLIVLLARKRSSEPRSDVLYRFRLNRYIRLVLISGLAVLNFLALLSSYYPEEEAIDLEIPFRQGTYYVMQGGNSPITNYFHRSHKSQQYALDITKLNNWGGRVNGLYSKDLNKYVIYGDTVLAPVSGKVLLTVDSFPDLAPPKLDKKNPLGNHVRIVTNDRMVVLAHLTRGSVWVKTGDNIQVGDPIGLVGNSGNSIEPHLHLQVVKMDRSTHTPNWEPVPFRLNGEFYHLNDRIRSK
jgi:murein DD-endopeptidase MepM/ murein hydrolase activator NlpD